MSARRMADAFQFTKKDAEERIKFLSIQARMWRSLSIIHAHHPELAKESMILMGLGGMIVGDLSRLEKLEKRFMEQAQRCGRSLSVFADEGPLCESNPRATLWREPK